MAFFQQHRRQLSIFLCLLAFFSLYALYGLPSIVSDPMLDTDTDLYLGLGSLGRTSGQKHPIELLVENARKRYTQMVESQSKSLEEAIVNYQKRYKRVPPPGFDDWYRTAVSVNATVIDNYDTVMAAFEPYWGISARELRARVREALDPKYVGGFLFGIRVQNHRLSTVHEDTVPLRHHVDILKDRMEPFLHFLPDMEFVFNTNDQPKVFAPHDAISKAISSCPVPEDDSNDPRPWEIYTRSPKNVYFNSVGRQRIWGLATLSCPIDSPSRSALSSQPPQVISSGAERDQLLFPQSIIRTKNVCELPEAGAMHGMFLSSAVLFYTNTLVPIFSRAKLSSNQDLIMPATDYSPERTSYKPYDESEDMPWDEKENRLYWTGSPSDGFFEDDKWRLSQRYRFVRDFNNASKSISLLQQNTQSSFWEPHQTTMETLFKHVYAKFTRVDHCSETECKRIKEPEEGLAFVEPEGIQASYGSKFAFDLDGAGFTERFQRLMHSHNTVFKMTLFQEWHDDFLVPWVHYVPVSLGMRELPETIRFFVETEKGQKIGKAIAEDGRRWAQQAWRPVDMNIVLFRILLEYGRLWGPERDRTGECPSDRKG